MNNESAKEQKMRLPLDSAKLWQLNVDQGDRVTTGTPLTKLDTSNLETKRLELLARKAQAVTVLEELQAGPRTEKIAALGEVELEPELAAIAQRNRRRVNTVQGFITARTLASNVLDQFQQQLYASFELPPGYSFEFGGEAEERDSAVEGLVSTVGVLTVLIVATLVLSLRSFQLVGVIGVVAVYSFGLGLLSVWLFGYPFGFNPIIGSFGLVGVAINDSIEVLAALQEDPVLAVASAGGVGATLLAIYLVPSAYLLLIRQRPRAVNA